MVRRWKFSTQVAFIYTLIIAIPLSLLILGVSEYLTRSIIASLFQEAERTVDEQARHVETIALQMERIESVVSSDFELNQFLLLADDTDPVQIIEKLIYHTKTLERITFTQPLIYKTNIFVHNPAIPERWPLIYREERMGNKGLDRWIYNYKNRMTTAIDVQIEPAVYLTGTLELQKRHVGYVQIGVRMTDFFPFLYQDTLAGNTNRTVVYCRDALVGPEQRNIPSFIEQIDARFPQAESGSWRFKNHIDEYLLAFRRIPRLGLTLVHWRSAKSLVSSISLIRFVSIGVLMLSVLVMFMVITGATNRLFTRLYQIMNGLRAIRDGNLAVSIHVGGSDEVAEMAGIFTSMVDRINKLIEEIKNEHALLAQTQIRAMQNQINAHFLYNVLETIKMQAELANQYPIVASITLLGRLMRYSLKLSRHQVPLEQELSYISDYITLLNIRNDYTIVLKLDIPQELLPLEIPKMLIQPVVENAVHHGIEPDGEDGGILIRCFADVSQNRWWVQVQDSGRGMAADALDRLKRQVAEGREPEGISGGIGLVNIQQRLWVLFGKEFVLDIESAPGAGTTVTMPLPLTEPYMREMI